MFKLLKSIFKNKNNTQVNEKKVICEKDDIEISTQLVFVSDQERYDKERLATKLKNDGKINEACELLYSIKDNLNIDTRLAMYLQQAGQFNKAKEELKGIIKNGTQHYIT